MPFLDEQELASLQKEIHDANVKRDELETILTNKKEELSNVKTKARGLNLFFATLAGIGLALGAFMYINSSNKTVSNEDITKIKQETTQRVLDSISTLEANNDNDEENLDIKTVDESIADIKSSTKGETIYSVQIGVFSKKKLPLLSKTIAGTTSQGNVFKYSVGVFKTLEEAQKFRQELVNIGFRDAFVASYINNVRQQIHKPN